MASQHKRFCIEDYHISPISGLLPEQPLKELPEYFKPWQDIGMKVAAYIEDGTLLECINQMPELDAGRLQTDKEKIWANVLLSFLVHGYVRSSGMSDSSQRTIRVPRQLAVPFCQVADSLGMPYVGTYTSIFMANYQLRDPLQPIDPSNMDVIVPIPGGSEAAWFGVCSIFVDYKALSGIQAIASVLEGVDQDDVDKVCQALDVVCKSLTDMIAVAARFYENVGERFNKDVKPFISGWGGEKSSAPDGVVFQGVSEEPVKLRGVAAAQSASVIVFDALLGIAHEQALAAFSDHILRFILPGHREMVKAVRDLSSVRQYVLRKVESKLTVVYNSCVEAVRDFRSTHIQLVTRFVINPSQTALNEGRQTKFDGGLAELLAFLKMFRDSTTKSVLDN